MYFNSIISPSFGLFLRKTSIVARVLLSAFSRQNSERSVIVYYD